MEKEYWGKKFYGSKLNTVLLLILIILMVFALKIMNKNKKIEELCKKEIESNLNNYLSLADCFSKNGYKNYP